MADLFCSFLDFRSFATNHKLPLILPSNHCYSLACHSHSSRISGTRRRPLHLTLFSIPSSPTPAAEIDVVSTHEHSDGSLIFRFGDPSEVAKNVKLEEPKTIKEEIEGESKIESSVPKVLESDNETETTAKKADKEVNGSTLTEVADHTNSIASNIKTITVVEGESESPEKFLEGSSDIELPVLTSGGEMERVYTPDAVDIESIENVEEGLNEEHEDSSPVESVIDEDPKVDSDIVTVELYENENADFTSTVRVAEVTSVINIEQTGNVEEGPNEEYADFAVDTPILDKSLDTVNNVSTVALSEKVTDDVTTTDVEIEKNGNEDEGVDKELEESSMENASDKCLEVENSSTALEFSRNESAQVTSLTDQNSDVPENGVLQYVSPISENQNEETEMQKDTTEDGGEGFGINLVSPSLHSEPALSLSEEIEERNLEAEMENVDIGKDSESHMSDITALEIKKVRDNDDVSEVFKVEAKSPPLEASMNLSVGSEEKASEDMIELLIVPPAMEADSALEDKTGIEFESVEESQDDDGSENLKVGGDLVEASIHEAALTESTPLRPETLTTNCVLSSGAALLPHPSKVLAGGEDAYFIAGRTWLGVADGVGQWSLEGTSRGVYAQELMKNCERLISNDNDDSIMNPIELLNLGVGTTHSPGSSTVLVARFNGQALHVANVGDSGFIVLRDGVVYKRSSPMHHVFHFPIQIERGDDPSSLAEFYRVDLEKDDVVITATNGLLDNLYDQEISSLVMEALAADKKLEEIAELLAMKAQEIGSSGSVRTPFGDNAWAAGFERFGGGKIDDVAVIVSVVQRQ